MTDKLPKVIGTSVIRSSNKGDSHGGLYLIDLDSSECTEIIDWKKMDINWEGRGMDRGMRGIAFYKDNLYIAISDEILIYDLNFTQIGSIKNDYLKHCHEIYIEKDELYLTSTGFDSVLEYDIINNVFINGYCLRFSLIKGYLNRFNLRNNLDSNMPRLVPRLQLFDPSGDDGPCPGDSLHINNVFVKEGQLFVCGRRLGKLLRIVDRKVSSYARVPYFTHNARPFNNGVIANNTRQNRVSILDKDRVELESFHIPHYDESKLLNNHLPKDYARQGFARGLCFYKDTIIAGSSPASISVYLSGNPNPIKSVNLTMDVRNAIHGLEVWLAE